MGTVEGYEMSTHVVRYCGMTISPYDNPRILVPASPMEGFTP